MVCTGLQWAHQQQAFDFKQYKFDAIILHCIQLHQIGLRHLWHSGTRKQNSFQGKQLEAPVQSSQWFPDVEWICSRNSGGSKQHQLDTEIFVETVVDGKREEITWQNRVQEGNFYFLLEMHVDFFFLVTSYTLLMTFLLPVYSQPTSLATIISLSLIQTNYLVCLPGSTWVSPQLWKILFTRKYVIL